MRGSRLIVSGLLAAVVATACGDDGGGNLTKTPGVLTVATVDASGDGFEADLITKIAERLDLTVEWVEADPGAILTRLADGEFDVVASATTITPERAEQVNFTEPYYNSHQWFTVNVTLTPFINDTDDLAAGDSVAVQTGTSGADWATENLAPNGVDVREFDVVGDAYNAAEAGQVTGVVSDEPSAVAEIANREGLEIVEVIDDERYGFALDPARTALLDQVNAAFRGMLDDGTYQAIYDTWFETPGGSVATVSNGAELTFVAHEPVRGTVGSGYFWDFCGPGAAPETQELSLLQCSPDPGGTPSGGHPPYHFQLDSGSGFPPMGLHLQKDGVINGTPTAATSGTTFRVCAVDLDANQACTDVTIIIDEPQVLDFTGTWQVDALSAVCPSSGGTWDASVTVAGGRLTGTWRDSYHSDQGYRIDVPIVNGTATWVADEGGESITLTGFFDLESGTVVGTLIGPVCTQAAGRWIGTFEGAAAVEGGVITDGDQRDVSVFDLAVGDCFQDNPAAGGQVSTVAVVDCDEPHDNEIYLAYSMTEAAFPGSEAAQAMAFDRCVSEFLDFVGIPYGFSELEVLPVTPTADSWAQGDRVVYCALYHFELLKLTGSMRDANR